MISIGEELRREREFREISLREISEATKINIRMLEAIEKDEFSVLPGGIFNRNFIRAYAQFIGLDPEVIIRKYQIQTGVAGDIVQAPHVIISPAGTARKSERKLVNLAIVAGILLLALLLFLGLKYMHRSPSGTEVNPQNTRTDRPK